MRFNRERVQKNVKAATTEDLLDRATVYREGMEPEALDIIEAELRSRGVDDSQMETHGERRQGEVRVGAGGFATRCSFCSGPAVAQGWGWHRLFGKVPVFPRFLSYCDKHRPKRRVVKAL
jgi:hypothetical protein